MLPLPAIDRLFNRLALTYGSAWVRQWEGLDANTVKSFWAHELSQFTGCLQNIAWALENLPERCPNLVQFKALCHQAPAAVKPALPEPKADPERLKAELAKLAPLATEMKAQKRSTDGREWARLIMQRFNTGQKVNQTSLAMARNALNLEAEAA
jgi:hypothetical protein